MKQFLIEARARFGSAVPPFFKRLQTFGASIATLGAALQVLSIPQKLLTIAGYIAVAGGVMVAVSQFAEKNAPNFEFDDCGKAPDEISNN